jgi:hypothetical protein
VQMDRLAQAVDESLPRFEMHRPAMRDNRSALRPLAVDKLPEGERPCHPLDEETRGGRCIVATKGMPGGTTQVTAFRPARLPPDDARAVVRGAARRAPARHRRGSAASPPSP